jgi:anaerobic dimethyl sulfoxide reductase subunit B (iron-sulfur subunit)
MEKCHFCEDRPSGIKRACEEICPTQAIVSGPVDELAKLSKRSVAEGLLDEKGAGVILGHD